MAFENFRQAVKLVREGVQAEIGSRLIENDPVRKPKIVSIEADTVRLFFPVTKEYASVDFRFPTLELNDSFLGSSRTEADFAQSGGKMYWHEPNDSIFKLDDEGEENEDGTAWISISKLAETHKVSIGEIQLASKEAKAAWLESMKRSQAA